MARLYIALGCKMAYAIMIIEGDSDGISLLAETWRWNFKFKQFSEANYPSQFVSLKKAKLGNAIQKPENQLFCKYVLRWSLTHQDQGHKYVDYVN